MLIAGAGGHALELLAELEKTGYKGQICFYDDVTKDIPETLVGEFRVLKDVAAVVELFRSDNSFCIGVGQPKGRKLLCNKLQDGGGQLTSVISRDAIIGMRDVILGKGLNIMAGAVITTKTQIGTGTLIHIHVSIHHDSSVGDFCELSPGCRILGGVRIGSFVSIGTNAVVMPNVHIGDYAVIAAGAVVTTNVLPGTIVKGIPAK